MIMAEYDAFTFHKKVLVIDFDPQSKLTTCMVKPLYAEQLTKDKRTILTYSPLLS